ncbi:hypothetical protein OGAPHI_002087 [Ogataea philodendri]|uniref:Uncharacterized protein n=1 Tax=Ogataea philodendri TaxID=1378263 RepID=A0A9P8P9T5_9ASCO|nr:uncharacterized protein OGAPHI_002087 [Ogataea philodendri]KAH3668333.1 hypothetical protein OGAPHI_002087 [Ogataea philodendri]
METPPVVIKQSMCFLSNASRMILVSELFVSAAIPRSTTLYPEFSTMEISVGRLLSTPIVGLRYTLINLTPTLANAPISPPPTDILDPLASTRLPFLVSEPTALIFSPDLTSCARISTSFSSLPSSVVCTSFVSSTITTALAPSGNGAPVVILAISPETSTFFSFLLACDTVTTGYVPGPSSATTA